MEILLDRAFKAAKADPKLCECGCNATTKDGELLPGHDARHKGALLRKYDGGDTEAGRTLVARGWATEEGLVACGDRSLDADEKRAATRDVKITRLDAQITALQAKRDAIAAEAN